MKKDQEAYVNTLKPEFSPFTIIHGGRINRPTPCRYVFGGYDCWHIVSRGNGYVISRGKKYLLEKGDLFSVMEDEEIEYGSEEKEGWEFYYLRIEGPAAKKITERAGFTPENPIVHIYKKEEALELFRRILSNMKTRDKAPEYCPSHLLLLFQILTEDTLPEVRLSPSNLVMESEKILLDPFAGNVNISELAALLHVSRGKLFSAFKEVKGVSPIAFLQKIRLKKVLSLLEEKELTLSRIAQQCFFPNEKYLIRFFRKHTGTTPGKYRKALQEKNGRN